MVVFGGWICVGYRVKRVRHSSATYVKCPLRTRAHTTSGPSMIGPPRTRPTHSLLYSVRCGLKQHESMPVGVASTLP